MSAPGAPDAPSAAALADLEEFAPLLRRAVALDPAGLVRVRRAGQRVSALIRLPFAVLVARTVDVEPRPAEQAPDLDVVLGCRDLLAWLDHELPVPPESRDAEWRSGVPPTTGWERVDTVPDTEVRTLVRAGALALQTATERDGLPGAQPRAGVTDALLDSVVLTVSSPHQSVGVTLRSLSALTRMGFLPRDSHIAVDVAGRWLRIAAAYGSVYAERPGLGLGLR
jgi:hypothetical protein